MSHLTEKQLRAALAAILEEEEQPSSAEVLASRVPWGEPWSDPLASVTDPDHPTALAALLAKERGDVA